MLVLVLLSHLSLSGAMQSGIFGGKEAKPHSRPYMASLQVRGYHVCGGVLIRQDYILTAAHCLKDKPGVVVLGAHNVSKAEKSQQRVGVSKSIPHPKYPTKALPPEDPRSRQHDIMLLELDPPVKLTEFVSVLELPKKFGYLKAGTRCEVAGWGSRVLGRGASVLYETTVTLDSNKKCKDKWKQYYDQDQMVCSVSDGKNGFWGDSGGPLVCGTGKSRILYATTAYTDCPCDKTDYPEAYMRVPFFLPWIRSVIGEN